MCVCACVRVGRGGVKCSFTLMSTLATVASRSVRGICAVSVSDQPCAKSMTCRENSRACVSTRRCCAPRSLLLYCCRLCSLSAVLSVHRAFDIQRAGNCERSEDRSWRSSAWWSIYRPAHTRGGAVTGLGTNSDCLLTGEGNDVVIVIIRHSRVGPGVGVFIYPSIQWKRSRPVVGSTVCESSQKPVMCWAGLFVSSLLFVV